MSQARNGTNLGRLLHPSLLVWGLVVCVLLQNASAHSRAWSQAAPGQGDPTQVLPKVVSFSVVGNERYLAEQLFAVLGQKIGEPLDTERIERGIRALWSAYRVRANVEAAPVSDGLDLRLTVQELALDFAPRFVGNETVSTKRLLEWAGLASDSELYLFQAQSVARRIENEYHKRGNAFVTINVIERGSSEEDGLRAGGDGFTEDVVFEIDEGPRVEVADVVVRGNESLPDKGWWLWRTGLRADARPALRGPRLLGLFNKYYDRNVLNQDLVAYSNAYRDAGYLDAVVQLSELKFNRDRTSVTIYLEVDEGPRFTVSRVRVEGVGFEPGPDGRLTEVPVDLAIPEQELLDEFKLRPGEPYQAALIALDEQVLRNRFGELGFISHPSIPQEERFSVRDTELVYDLDKPEVEVRFRVAQGVIQRIREVRFSGNARTRDSVLRREISVFPGDAADLVEIERSLARLRGTGYFSSLGLDPSHPDPIYRFVPTDRPGWKDLEYAVETGDSLRIDLGVQYGSDNGLAGQLGFTFQNFDISRWPSLTNPFEDIYQGRAWRGAGQTLEVSASPGTDFSRFRVRFTEPDLRGDYLERIGLTVDLNRRLRGFSTHNETRDSVGASLFKQLDPDTVLSVGFEHVSIELDNVFTGGSASLFDPASVPSLLLLQPEDSELAGLEARLRRTRLDNRQAPRQGYTWNLGGTFYDDFLGSDFEFIRFDGSFDQYGWLSDSSNGNYHLRLQTGIGVPFGDTDTIPFTERYFLGGSRLLRGFDFRGIGPSERDFAIGGETMFAGSLEVLWPLASRSRIGQDRPTEVFRFGGFVDWGILDPDPFSLDLTETRLSVGFTLQLRVPLPLAFNFGFPILEEEGDDLRTFSFSISN